MTETQARKILGAAIEINDGLYDPQDMAWNAGDEKITLDGEFSADKLEAIAWWMKNKEGWLLRDK